jgi:hypothetical protein
MPHTLQDIAAPQINIKIDPTDIQQVITDLQNEINRTNREFMQLLVEALGTYAYTDVP